MLEVCDIFYARGGRQLFAGLSFHVQAGEALMITGPNGVGKTSLLRLLARLSAPEQGIISYQGAMAYLGHEAALKPGLTVAEELGFWYRLRNVDGPCAETARSILNLNGFAHLPCRLLSSGQRRRVALARIADSGAAMWLLDEPTVGLDDASIKALIQLISNHLSTGGVAVIATHVAMDLPKQIHLKLGDIA